jgi:hypothetical protein
MRPLWVDARTILDSREKRKSLAPTISVSSPYPGNYDNATQTVLAVEEAVLKKLWLISQ